MYLIFETSLKLVFKRYSKLPVSFCLAIKFVYNFFLKDFTFFSFFTSMDSSFQFLIVRTLKVRPPVFILKTGQWKFKFAKHCFVFIFCFLSRKTWSLTWFSITCSWLSIRVGIESREASRESRLATDCQLSFERCCSYITWLILYFSRYTCLKLILCLVA